jgi:hypothetical protein
LNGWFVQSAPGNIGLAIWRLKFLYEIPHLRDARFTLGILLNFCAKIRHIAKLKNVMRHAN